jgi:hypothetical protein
VDHSLVLALLRPFLKQATYRQLRSFILPLGRDIVAANKRGEDKVLYDAPTALLFHVSPYADAADAVIACTYAMIAAEALGLGSCMIGCVAPPLSRNRKLCAKHGIPAGHKPALVLILGHPAVSYRRAVRRRFSPAAKTEFWIFAERKSSRAGSGFETLGFRVARQPFSDLLHAYDALRSLRPTRIPRERHDPSHRHAHG